MLDSQRKIAYGGAVADRKIRKFVPPARLVRALGVVKDAEVLVSPKPAIQSYLHFDPPFCDMAPGSEIILDFGVALHGGVRIVTGLNKMEAAKVLVVFGESVSETLGEPTNDHAMHKMTVDLPPLGMSEIGNTVFRFVRIVLGADAPNNLQLIGVPAVAIYRDLEYVGSFKSNDERLDRIWQTAAYTVHLCMQDYIYDGAKRDRLVWMGDLYPEVRVVAGVFNDLDAVESSLDFMRDHTPDEAWMNGISSYSCWWVICHADWYRWRGGLDYLGRQREALKVRLAQLIAAVGPDGNERLPEYRFLDWPNADDPEVIHAGLQGLLAWALTDGADLADALGLRKLARDCRAKALLLGKNPPPVGLNKTAAAMQVLGGILDPAKAEREVFSVDPYRGVSTFYGYFVLLARARAGAMAPVLELIRKYWGGMLDFGATTFWEDFDLDWTRNCGRIDELPQEGRDDLHADFGKHCYVGLRHSLSHGWSGGPAAFIAERVLGITPLEPGFRRFRCAPDPGDLEWFEGAVPTPHGAIGVRLTPAGMLELTVPEGCVAVLADGREAGPGRRRYKFRRK